MAVLLEQWPAAVGRWVACIQGTLIIKIWRGVKRLPFCASSQEGASSPLGQPHSEEKKCTGIRKGRKERKDDSFDDPAITTDEFSDQNIALAMILRCFRRNTSKDCSYRNPVGPLKELLDCTGLGAIHVVIMILLQCGDVETNPGPVERGGANSDSDPILSQGVHNCEKHAFLFRKHVSRKAAGKGKAILECLGLSSSQIKLCYQNNPYNEEEAIQDGLNKWCETHSGNCTWRVLLHAMKFAGIAQQDCKELVEELHQGMQGPATLPPVRENPSPLRHRREPHQPTLSTPHPGPTHPDTEFLSHLFRFTVKVSIAVFILIVLFNLTLHYVVRKVIEYKRK